jgi:hypothetical protein
VIIGSTQKTTSAQRDESFNNVPSGFYHYRNVTSKVWDLTRSITAKAFERKNI